MSIPSSLTPLFSTGSSAAAGGYQVSRSLRFNSADSAHLSRTPAVAGNRRIFTWAGWVKRVKDDASPVNIFAAGANNFRIAFGVGATAYLQVYDYNGSSYNFNKGSAASYRDFSAWYHIVVAIDTTNATADDRVKMYVNGSRITDLYTGTNINPSQNLDTYVNNTSNTHYIGYLGSSALYLDSYLADIHFIDGQALTPSSFTEVSATTGQLIPLAYSGTYTGNSFWLKFNDNSAATAATLGKDSFLLGNNWTPNNLSVTAGAGNDSLVDTPTSYGTDTGVGGEVRGNYATLNALRPASYSSAILTNGNLNVAQNTTAYVSATSTIGVSSGKWYWEVTCTSIGLVTSIGITSNLAALAFDTGVATYHYDGGKYINGVNSAYGSSYTTGDIIGFALDLDSGTLVCYKNGVTQGTLISGLSGIYYAYITMYDTCNVDFNFGQRPFAYQTPGTNRPAATFLALCDTNLPAPLTAKPNTLFDVVLYTGTGATQTLPNASSTPSTPLGFSPDFLWFKNRSGSNNHALFDTVRTRSAGLYADLTNAEVTSSAGSDLSSFDATGFTVGTPQNFGSPNSSGASIVAWAWDAGTSTDPSNTAGSITSQVRANVSAGFSVVTYTGNGTDGATVGHGLGVTPGMIIVKNRDDAHGWIVAHSGLTNYNSLWLNETAAASAGPGRGWINPYGSSTFTLKAGNGGTSLFDNVNQNTIKYVAYCFAPVVGYSSFGSYTGNGSADGPFVYTGFRPRFVLLKGSSFVSNWHILDAARNAYNVTDRFLRPNLSSQEFDGIGFGSGSAIDILSNGFKLKASFADSNTNAASFVYAAFAESPFQYARAR